MSVKIKIPGDSPKEKIGFLFENPDFLKGKFLGAVLDSCRWGSADTVLWERGPRDMALLVDSWTKQNKNNLPGLFHPSYEVVSLPSINPYENLREREIFVSRSPRVRDYPVGSVLPLEEVFDRLDVNRGNGPYYLPENTFIVPLDGFQVAGFSRAWYQQVFPGFAPVTKD